MLDVADFIPDVPERRRNTGKKEDDDVEPGMIVPNPNTRKITYIYNTEKSENSELQIYNSRGRIIQSFKLNRESKSLEIDLSNQPSGFYVYRILLNGSIYPGNKIIIEK
jgi:hypothetical protein